jgi:hypothetical protein
MNIESGLKAVVATVRRMSFGHRSILVRAMTAVVVVLASLALAAAPARAAAGNHNMTPQATNWHQCLDIGANTPGTYVGLSECNGGLSQEWWWNCKVVNFQTVCQVSSASSGYGLCWDLRSYDTGSVVILNGCDATLASQLWDIDDYKIVSVGSSRIKCLDLRSYARGTPAGLNWCNSTLASQKWLWRWTS